jgi:hypothetical protein
MTIKKNTSITDAKLINENSLDQSIPIHCKVKITDTINHLANQSKTINDLFDSIMSKLDILIERKKASLKSR